MRKQEGRVLKEAAAVLSFALADKLEPSTAPLFISQARRLRHGLAARFISR
jgi:hypothetical protein